MGRASFGSAVKINNSLHADQSSQRPFCVLTLCLKIKLMIDVAPLVRFIYGEVMISVTGNILSELNL